VVLALVPVVAVSAYYFRWLAFALLVTCVVTAVLTEAVVQRIRRQPLTLYDGSAVVSGLLLALTLPPALPWWAAVLGTIFALMVGKHLFGGLGANVFNPALVGRAFLAATFPVFMTTWTQPLSLHTMSAATPLGALKFGGQTPPVWDLLLGNVGGCLGETSALAILAGGVYLVGRRYADWRTPVGYLGTVALLSAIFWLLQPDRGSPVFHLLAGGLMFGAVYMATDPVTTPVTRRGRFLFGMGAGVVVMVIRFWGTNPEGVMFSLLFMNALTPLLNRTTIPRPLGGQR
jgi:electron transport complex protein RnfD